MILDNLISKNDINVKGEIISDVKGTSEKAIYDVNGRELSKLNIDKSSVLYPDIENWISSTLPSSTNWRSVCYGNGKFVAVSGKTSSTNKAAYSADGINWTAATLPSSASWESVCYGNGKYVAVTSGTNNNDNSSKAAYSTDGINWTETTLPSSGYWDSVCYGNGKFVAVSYNDSNKAIYSTDGITWTATTLPSSASWQSVCYSNGKFVTVATHKAAYLQDKCVINPELTNTIDSYYGNSTYKPITKDVNSTCLQKDSNSYYYNDSSSYKLSNISSNSSDTFTNIFRYKDYLYAIKTNGDKTLWKGSFSGGNFKQLGKTVTNTGGITTLPSIDDWFSVCYGNGKFVAIAYNSNKAAYSTDGIHWTATTLPSSAYWRSVCYGNGKFVAVVFNSNIAAYSIDGITWTAATLPSDATWFSVCYGDGKFVAVTYNSNIAAYSTDGINWISSTLPSDASWSSVCYGNGKFVTVAGNDSNRAAYCNILTQYNDKYLV